MRSLRLLRALVGEETCTLPALISARCSMTPDRPFILYGDITFKYGEVFERACGFSSLLIELGESNSGRVASLLRKTPEAIWLWFGAALAGTPYVPINPDLPGAALEDLIVRSRATALLIEAAAWTSIAKLSLPALRYFLFVDSVPSDFNAPVARAIAIGKGKHGAFQAPEVNVSSEAGMLYTSGTSGRPKAVVFGHSYYCRSAAVFAEAAGITDTDIFIDWAPQYHVGNQVDEVLTTLIAGGALALVPGFSRRRFWTEARQYGATLFGGFSNVFKYLLSTPPSADDLQHKLRLGFAVNTPIAIVAAFEDRFGLPLVDYYGMTEAPIVTVPDIGRQPAAACGRPSRDIEVAIHDNQGYDQPTGQVGRIVLRPRVPDVVMRRYEGDPDATVDAWRDLWFHTQDMGYLDADGYLFFVGRLATAIRRGGENIAPSEIEQTVLRHPDVGDCLAVGVKVDIGDEEVKLVVVPAPGTSSLDPAIIYAHCRTQLARYMMPRFIRVVDCLAYTDAGKADRSLYQQAEAEDWDAREHDG